MPYGRDSWPMPPNLNLARSTRGRGPGSRLPTEVLSGFAGHPRQLERFLYTPAGLEPGAPLVVVLHGCGQEAGAFARSAGWLTLADRNGFCVLAPGQTAANNPNRCFNWFLREDITRGAGEVACIAAMITALVEQNRLDSRRVFITGLSAGGAMTLAMLASYPELFAGGAVFGAIPFGVAGDVSQAMRTMRQGSHLSAADLGRLVPNSGRRALPPLSVWHGGLDAVVTPQNGGAIASQWALAQGLTETPDESEVHAGRSRSVWRRRGGREVAVELNIIDALGHGVPLATRGPEALGRTAPFMIEAGVSSSLEVARFWGLSPPGEPGALPRPIPLVDASSVAGEDRLSLPPLRPSLRLNPPATRGVAAQAMKAVNIQPPSGVRETIVEALKAAGLMR